MPYDLNRFIEAQNAEYNGYEAALNEIKRGRKQGHWILYVFPLLKELGRSYNAKYYGIDGMGEAKAYLAEPILRQRLIEITKALLALDKVNPTVILGLIDAKKVKSCMSLFMKTEPELTVFRDVIDKFYSGQLDKLTLSLLNS